MNKYYDYLRTKSRQQLTPEILIGPGRNNGKCNVKVRPNMNVMLFDELACFTKVRGKWVKR